MLDCLLVCIFIVPGWMHQCNDWRRKNCIVTAAFKADHTNEAAEFSCSQGKCSRELKQTSIKAPSPSRAGTLSAQQERQQQIMAATPVLPKGQSSGRPTAPNKRYHPPKPHIMHSLCCSAAGDEEVQYVYVSLPTDLDPLAFGPGATVTIEVISSFAALHALLCCSTCRRPCHATCIFFSLCRAWRQSTQCCGLLSPASLAAAAT